MALVARLRFGARQSARQPSYDLAGDVTVWVEYRDSETNALTGAAGVAFVVTKADGSILSPAPAVVTEQAGIYRCVFTPDQPGLWAIEASSTTSGATNDRREFLMVSDSIPPSVIGPTAVTSVNDVTGPTVVLGAANVSFARAETGFVSRSISTKLRDALDLGDFTTVADAIAAAKLVNKVVRVQSPITVRVPADAATIGEALTYLWPDPASLNPVTHLVTIMVQAGHRPAIGAYVYHRDCSSFLIDSEDAEILVADTFPLTDATFGAFVFGDRSRLPILGTVVNMNGRGWCGYYARNNSSGWVLPDCGIKNLGSGGTFGIEAPGLFANIRSAIYAFEAVVTGNPRNLWASRGSFIDGEFGTFDDATGDLGVYMSRSSELHAPNASIQNCAIGVMLRRSRATLDSANLSGCGTGLYVERTSQCSITSRGAATPVIDNCTSDAVVVQEASSLHIQGCSIANAGRDAVIVRGGARVTIIGSTITNAVRYGVVARTSGRAALDTVTVTGAGTANLDAAQGGSISVVATTTGDGLRAAEVYDGQVIRDGFDVLASPSIGYGRYRVTSTGGGVGFLEYSDDAEWRFGTASGRQMRLLDNGTLRPEADNTNQLGATDRRWTNVWTRQLRLGAAGVRWFEGAGAPEGVHSADPGSLYTRTDGVAGGLLYVKASGTGPTGWSVLF